MTHQMATNSTRIIGIGNEFRCDDGVGVFVARLIKARNIAGVEVIERSGEGAELIQSWRGANNVFLIDAVSSGSNPGTIHRIDAKTHPIPLQFFHYSTHAFSIAEAIEMAKILSVLPERCVVFGIEGTDFGWGERLSEPVRNAGQKAAAMIVEEINRDSLRIQEPQSEDQTQRCALSMSGESYI